MVVWLALDGGVVDEEIRYWAIERARRCLPVGELPDGWWTDRPVPTEPPPATEDLDTPTEPLVFGGATISVFNGMPNLNRLLAWGLVRFETAGLTPPTITSATFTVYSEFCDDLRARYRPTAQGADLEFCFGEDDACWVENCPSFSLVSRRLVLHELAHGSEHPPTPNRLPQSRAANRSLPPAHRHRPPPENRRPLRATNPTANRVEVADSRRSRPSTLSRPGVADMGVADMVPHIIAAPARLLNERRRRTPSVAASPHGSRARRCGRAPR